MLIFMGWEVKRLHDSLLQNYVYFFALYDKAYEKSLIRISDCGIFSPQILSLLFIKPPLNIWTYDRFEQPYYGQN